MDGRADRHLKLVPEDPSATESFNVYLVERRKARTYLLTSTGALLAGSIATYPTYDSGVMIGTIIELLGWLLLATSLGFGTLARLKDVEVHRHLVTLHPGKKDPKEWKGLSKEEYAEFIDNSEEILARMNLDSSISSFFFQHHAYMLAAGGFSVLLSRSIAVVT